MDVVLCSSIASILMIVVSGNSLFPMNIDYNPNPFFSQSCRGILKDSSVRANLGVCSLMRRSLRTSSSPAKIDKIGAHLNIQSDGELGISVTFEALSPNSAQTYFIKVDMFDPGEEEIYCGEIRTPNPSSTDRRARHKFKINLDCPSREFTPGKQLKIEVSSGRNRFINEIRRMNYEIPGCSDNIMARSVRCRNAARSKVDFKLKQVGNGTLVKLDKKSAYQNNKDTKINLQLRLEQDGFLNGWKPIGSVVVLNFPQTKHLFTDLTPGEVYSVLAWRNSEHRRYYKEITLKRKLKKDGRDADRKAKK